MEIAIVLVVVGVATFLHWRAERAAEREQLERMVTRALKRYRS